jgi:hypothetical protein
MNRARSSSLLVAGALLGLAFSSAGCAQCGSSTSGGRATKDDMALIPREAGFVLMANVAEMRDTPLWKKVAELRDSSESKAKFDDFVKKTGLDPMKQVDSVFAGFPTAKGTQEFALIARGGPFDEQKLVDYAKAEALKDGSEVVTTDYNGKKLYGDKSGQAFVAFLDGKTVVMGGKEWIKKVIDLAKAGGDSAAKNDALMAIVKKTRTGESFWGAGIIPEEARASLKDDPRLAAAATMKQVYASIDVKGGLAVTAAIDLAGEPEAKDLTAKVSEQLGDAKKNPQVQMMGFTQYLDAIKVRAEGPTFHLDVKLTQPQVDALIAQLQGLFKTLGSSLGGGGGAPGGGTELPPAPPAQAPAPNP